ncbi:MAG: phage holin family protein [Candidatus Portnoybacteria bacterium]|nr:phage holin family protein [Candidatus Portnoybacteria bacterium]
MFPSKPIVKWVIISLVIFGLSSITPGIKVASFSAALVAALVLGLINLIIRPIILFFTLPINILTLGLFTFIINASLILLTAHLVSGFEVKNFWWALFLSLVISIVNSSMSHKPH